MSSCTTSHVTLRQLEALAAVADAGGFTAAAELLGRSQPTVSKEIQTLERTLRHELVTRSGRNTRLSEEGLRLLPRAESCRKSPSSSSRRALLSDGRR